MQNLIKKFRADYHPFNAKIHWIEEKVGVRVKFISIALEKTRPNIFHHNDDK